MYNYEDITSIHLEVTSKCQARCPMCPRRLHGGPLLDGLDLEEINLETFINWFPKTLSPTKVSKYVVIWRFYCCSRHPRNF